MSGRRLPTERLVRHVLGDLSGEEREETAQRIADSRSEGEREAALREMIDGLRRPPGWAASVDLVGGVRAGIEREATAAGREPRRVRQPPRRWTRRWIAGGAAVAAAAVALVMIGRGRPSVDGDPEMTGVSAKGGGGAADPDRWVRVRLAQGRGGGGAAPITPGQHLGPGELQVSYTNLGPRPYARLMVFAVDAEGEVRWFYPAFQDPGTDPEAIAIEAGAVDAILPDRIEHDLPRGRLAVCGLFLPAPLTVSQVESALDGGQPAPGARLPFPGSGQHCFDLVVE